MYPSTAIEDLRGTAEQTLTAVTPKRSSRLVIQKIISPEVRSPQAQPRVARRVKRIPVAMPNSEHESQLLLRVVGLASTPTISGTANGEASGGVTDVPSSS